MLWIRHLYLLAAAPNVAEAFSGIKTSRVYLRPAITTTPVHPSRTNAPGVVRDDGCRTKKCFNGAANGRFSMQIRSATASDDDTSNSDGSKSIFEQSAFKLQFPWDDNNADADAKSQSSQGWQWWPNNSEETKNRASSSPASKPASPAKRAALKRPRQRHRKGEPRVAPRYPSAFQSSRSANKARASNVNRKEDVEKYVESAANAARTMERASEAPRRKPKVGILLIDHGSKRRASNEHLDSIAASYQSVRDGMSAADDGGDGADEGAIEVVVRAAHMEIALPSIVQALRRLVDEDGVTRAVCVPYFLSPGKHATVDVPQLIDEAREILNEERLLAYEGGEVEISSTKALGSNVEGMLKVVDGLVRGALEERGYDDLFELAGSEDNANGNDIAPKSFENNGEIHETDEERQDLSDRIILLQRNINKAEKELNKYTNRATLLENMLETKAKDAKTMANRVAEAEKERQDFSDRVTLLESNIHEAEKELNKYTNRATLLENALGTKAKEAKTMANRVALMEDAMTRVKDKSQKEREQDKRQRDKEEHALAAQVANLTEKIEGIQREKEVLEEEAASLARQRIEMETDYNSTIANLEAMLASSEQGMQQRRGQTENREEELQGKIQSQQLQIQELQAQLAELLEAHTELEQLQTETEVAARKSEDRLRDTQVRYESLLEAEQEEKDEYKAKWMDVQRQMEENGKQLRQKLNESASEYESLLEEERGRTEEWMEKWKTLYGAQTDVGNATSSQSIAVANMEEEFAELRKESEEVAMAMANATAKVQDLEQQLRQQKQQHEESSNSSLKKVEEEQEQQKQLQEYLRAQLSTYYETIQTQTVQISELEQQIKDTKQAHEESMLIATNSVEASQRREATLLTNVEELERELSAVTKEKDESEKELDDLQARLDKMKKDAATSAASTPSPREDVLSPSNKHDDSSASSPSRESLTQHNEKLMRELAGLRSKMRTVSQEKERVSSEKIRLEEEISRLFFVPRRVRDLIPAAQPPSPASGEAIQKKGKGRKQRRRRRWVRGVLRPWTLLRKQTDDDADQ